MHFFMPFLWSLKWGAGPLQTICRRAAAVRGGIGDSSSWIKIDFFLCKVRFRTQSSSEIKWTPKTNHEKLTVRWGVYINPYGQPGRFFIPVLLEVLWEGQGRTRDRHLLGGVSVLVVINTQNYSVIQTFAAFLAPLNTWRTLRCCVSLDHIKRIRLIIWSW